MQEELTKLPISLGLKVNDELKRIFKAEGGYRPRVNNYLMPTFEYTKEELEMIKSLSFTDPVLGALEGIELLPNLKNLKIESNGYYKYVRDKDVPSITDKDAERINQCKNLESLDIRNQSKLSFLDISELSNLKSLKITECDILDEIYGMEDLKDLWSLTLYGNEFLTNIENLDKIIDNNDELLDLNLDIMLYPDAVGYDLKTGKSDEKMKEKLEELDAKWHSGILNGKSVKINNKQMENMHDVANNVLEEYIPKTADKYTTAVGIELYLAQNVKYDSESLEHSNSHVDSYEYKDESRKSKKVNIRRGSQYSANGPYNALMYGFGVCEGYTRSMQYLLKLKGIKSHDVFCIGTADTLHMSSSDAELKELQEGKKSKYDDKIYDIPNGGRHSIICIDDLYGLYCDPCWNATIYQQGYESLQWTFLTKEGISKDHTLSFLERNISNNNINLPSDIIETSKKRVEMHRVEFLKRKIEGQIETKKEQERQIKSYENEKNR